MKIAIVTDSTADISPEESAEHNITIIPAVVVIEGQEFLDGEGMSREEFYRRLPALNPPPTTAAPSSGMFRQAYQSLFAQGYEHIFSIHVASTLSGMVNAAKMTAKSFNGRVTVIDSGQLSLGIGFQVLAAAKAALQGSLELVDQAIRSVQERIRVVAMIDSLEQLKRSGRVSWMKSGLGSLFRIKLFVELKEGEVLRIGEVRTRSKGIERLEELLTSMGPLEQLAVVHTNALADATAFAERIKVQVANTLLIRNVTTVIGTHLGVNALGFVVVKAD